MGGILSSLDQTVNGSDCPTTFLRKSISGNGLIVFRKPDLVVSYYSPLSLSVLTLFLIELRVRLLVEVFDLRSGATGEKGRASYPPIRFLVFLLRELEF